MEFSLTHRIVKAALVSFGFGLSAAPLSAQTPKPIAIKSCPSVDSLIGADRLRPHGRVFVTPDSAHQRTIYNTGTRLLSRRSFHVTAVTAQDWQDPPPITGGDVRLWIEDRGLEGQVDSMTPPALTVELGDSVTLHFGAVVVHPQRQSGKFPYVADISLWMAPASFLALVRSQSAIFEFLGRRLKADQHELDDMQAVFRAAACRLPSQ